MVARFLLEWKVVDVSERPKYGQLTIEVQPERNDHGLIVRLAGELDLSNAKRVEGELARIEADEAEAVVLDLSDLEFLDSTGLRILLAASQRSERAGKRMEMRGATESVRRVLEITGVYDRMPFSD